MPMELEDLNTFIIKTNYVKHQKHALQCHVELPYLYTS